MDDRKRSGYDDMGRSPCAPCGNGILDPRENCDFGGINGATCGSVTAGLVVDAVLPR